MLHVGSPGRGATIDRPRPPRTELPVLEIEVDATDGYTLCRPVGELDAYTVTQFRDILGELATHPRVVIDLSDVPFMDSAGLGALIGGIRAPPRLHFRTNRSVDRARLRAPPGRGS